MLRDEIKLYTQPNGLITERTLNPSNDTTGNGLLNLSLYYALLWNRKELLPLDKDEFHRVVKTCACVPSFPVPLNRSPTKIGDQTGWDDYIGVALASLLLGDSYAMDIYEYGKSSGWMFNNVQVGEFSWSAFFGRNPAISAYFMLCGGKDLSYLERLAMQIHICCRSSDATSQILAWCMNTALLIRGVKVKNFDIDGALKKYLSIEHPIVKYWV